MSAARLVLGSRGSALARAQTEMAIRALRFAWPDIRVEVRIIKTAGDESAIESIEPEVKHAGRKGMFTAAIERALLENEIDVAVHSAKDLPSECANGAMIGAVLERAEVHDVLVSKKVGGIKELPRAALVATGSVRRAHQLKLLRADCQIADLRGNVPTRLRKLRASNWDAAIFARAGLERLGFDLTRDSFVFEDENFFVDMLSLEDFVPAGGQGAIALQIRTADEPTQSLVKRVNHRPSFLCVGAEREFLRLLHGDCDSPVGVLAVIEGDEMKMRAQVFEENGDRPLAGSIGGSLRTDSPESIAAALYAVLYGEG